MREVCSVQRAQRRCKICREAQLSAKMMMMMMMMMVVIIIITVIIIIIIFFFNLIYA